MVVFGLILLLLALIVIGYVWLATAGMTPVSIDYGFLNVEVSPWWLFLAGGITLAVATSGLWLIGVGAKSSARRAREVRELRRQAKESDRRAERSGDRASLGTGTDRGPGSAGTDQPSGRTDKDGPILPRAGTRAGDSHPRPGSTAGPPEGTGGSSSSLDVDR